MRKIAAVAYGLACYAAFSGTFLYAIGFVDGLLVPKHIDSPPAGPVFLALLIDLALLGVFAVQHSVMARPVFKAWWTRFVPKPVERSTYVLFASLALALVCWQWRAIPGEVWSVQGATADVVWGLNLLGWTTVAVSTFLLNHFDLFGLRQVWAYATGKAEPEQHFRTPFLYRVVRHPLYLGFLMAFWAAPTMSVGHLLFAVGCTGYVLLAIFFEERDLVNAFGETYRGYQKRVSMLLPWIPRA